MGKSAWFGEAENDRSERIVALVRAEAMAFAARLATGRVVLALVLVVIGNFGIIELMTRGPLTAFEFWSGVSGVLATTLYLPAAVVYRSRLKIHLREGAPSKVSEWLLAAMTTADVATLAWGSCFPLLRLKALGVAIPHGVTELALTLPCLIHCFQLDLRWSRLWGWAASCIGLLTLHLAVPMDKLTVPYWPSPFVASAVYFGIYALGRANARRVTQLVAQSADREVLRDRLARVLPPKALARMESDGGIYLGGERRECAILFADVRGFTALAESTPPERVLAFLNEYYRRMVDVVFAHGGTLDKFIGDAVLAVFDDDKALQRSAKSAVDCAVAMQRELDQLNQDRRARGEQALAMVVSIHVGPVISGWLGSERRPEYTVVGDTVNVASRLEGVAKDVSEAIVISAETDELVATLFNTRPIGTFALKGKAKTVKVFAVDRKADDDEQTAVVIPLAR